MKTPLYFDWRVKEEEEEEKKSLGSSRVRSSVIAIAWDRVRS